MQFSWICCQLLLGHLLSRFQNIILSTPTPAILFVLVHIFLLKKTDNLVFVTLVEIPKELEVQCTCPIAMYNCCNLGLTNYLNK